MFTYLNGVVDKFVDWLIPLSTEMLMPGMAAVFIVALIMRYLVYYTVKRHDWFAVEFEKRVARHLETGDKNSSQSFYALTKSLLERTFYELFETREKLKRRKSDPIMHWSDRLFLIKPGSAWLVKDVLRQVRFLKFESEPKLINIAKNTFENNPFFTRVFGLFSASTANDVLNILPGLFVIAGIFGTFLGIMKGLPELGKMDLTNPEATKLAMDAFLLKVAFKMRASIMGIVFSVALSIMNTVFSPEKLFATMIDRFENSLNLIWNVCTNNDIPKDLRVFDEHRDPIEALAEQSINAEVQRKMTSRKAVADNDLPQEKQDDFPMARTSGSRPDKPTGKPSRNTEES